MMHRYILRVYQHPDLYLYSIASRHVFFVCFRSIDSKLTLAPRLLYSDSSDECKRTGKPQRKRLPVALTT